MAGSIRYIKIAKIDKNGVDLTTQLESINTLILPSASKFVEYNILNKSRFNDYFLYYVTPPNRENIDNDITSSLKYDFTGSMSTSTVTTPILTINALPISSSDSDNLGFFDSTTNTYNINTLPQKDLTVQIQGNLTISGDFFDSVSVGIYKLSPTTTYYDDVILGELISQTFNANAGSTSINKTFTIPKENINPGDQLSIRTRKVSGVGFLSYNITFGSGAKFKVSSTPATGTTKQAIIEPYFTTDFYKSEYDVLQNNAIKGIPNQSIQEIDYNSGIIPTNIQAIISGSAEKGTIPESFFTMGGMINPSYSSVNTVSEYNKEESAFTTQVSSGVFVAYFDSYQTLRQFNQEKYQTRFNFKYLITPEEELIEISNDPTILYTLLYNFGTNANPNTTYDFISAGGTDTNRFGQIDGSVKLRATTFSTGSFDTSGDANSLEWKGDYRNFLYQGNIQGIAYTTGSIPGILGSASEFQNIGGILFPASIGLTSAAELPSKAKEILTKNNIIAPSNTTS